MERSAFFSYKSKNLKNIRVLCGLALFCAVFLVLRSFTVNLSPSLRISFSFLATAASCYFFGLWPNIAAAFVCDLLGFLIHPDGAYIPLYALVPMSAAVIFSLFFYDQPKISVGRVIAAKAVMTIVCNLILNPLILSLVLQTPFFALFTARLMKNLILFPLECVLLYFILQLCIRLKKHISWL